jgi:hypothetical protein
MHREIDLAWAAGFFEGEGSATMHGPRFAAQIKNNDAAALARFRTCVEAGRIYGPYMDPSRFKNVKPFWMWLCHDTEAIHVMSALAPWLTERRLLQLELTLGKVKGTWSAQAEETADWVCRVRKGKDAG